jgi:hypothetical protein
MKVAVEREKARLVAGLEVSVAMSEPGGQFQRPDEEPDNDRWPGPKQHAENEPFKHDVLLV